MQVTICDVCETRKNIKTRSFFVDRRMGPAGSMENEFETFDLCPSCFSTYLHNTLKEKLRQPELTQIYIALAAKLNAAKKR